MNKKDRELQYEIQALRSKYTRKKRLSEDVTEGTLKLNFKTLKIWTNEAELKGRQEAREEVLDEIKENLNEANQEVADEYFNETCENCSKTIDPSIHHYVDSFYRNMAKKIEKLKESTA